MGVSTKPTQIDATASRHLLPLSAESRKAAEKKNRKTGKPKNRKTENRKPKTENRGKLGLQMKNISEPSTGGM